LLTGKINQTAEDNVLLAEKGFYDWSFKFILIIDKLIGKYYV
jgi:hypothetical protein